MLLDDYKDTAILDAGCARYTLGEEWIEEQIVNISEEDRLEDKRKEGKSSFQFGNGKSFKFKGTYIIPVYCGNEKRAMICVDVLDSKTPLPICPDATVICGKKIKMHSVGGRYYISLRKRASQAEDDDSEGVSSTSGEDVDNEGLIICVLDDPDSWKK